MKGFYIYKISLHKQNATAIISGAFGAFRKDILMQAGGYRKTLGEDIDITLKIQFMIKNTNKKILYMPEALCYTQCPENWKDLFRQRIRWQKGFINCFFVL
jgi:cellulose synthase/poly-beta-1,6-N-acetylglucosamine synthase-like glycosyltransferase